MKSLEEPSGKVIGLFVGEVENLWPGKPPSAINKQAVEGPLAIEKQGFFKDQQADLTVHGGAEKAIHHYASEHMAFWQAEFPQASEKFKPGCFGENISSTGLTEDNLCIGDVLSTGSAKVQVCQGRQPCWKLSEHLGLPILANKFQTTAKTGWYYRVIETGKVQTGDSIQLLDRLHPELTIRTVTQARFNPRANNELVSKLLELNELSESWRSAFAKKASKISEKTDERLFGRSSE